MAVTAQKTVASLMQKTLDRQAAIARMKISFKKHQIEQVLLSYIRDGNSGPYNELLKILRDNTLNDCNFRVLFEDCLDCVVYLGRELKPFVDVLCSIEWASRDEELVNVYSRFLLSLVTAHTYHSTKIMAALVKLFKAEGENWEDTPSTELVLRWSNIHTVIAKIVAVMPMTSDLLMQTVIEHFPYFKAGCFPNRAYIHNLIWMSKYLPCLTEQIMTAIVSKMVDMDANIVDRDKHKSQDTIFDMEMDEKDEVSDTLDYCMLEMLKWLEDERDQVLSIMCNVFERVILPTHGIRHVQFLLLYTISISQQCADRIFTNLWIVAAGLHGLGPGALATRRTAASHLAGLLARCVRVPNSRLVFYLRTMSEWCHAYVTATQESTVADNTKVHGAFHAVCHAIFYLVAFKNHHLFMNKESKYLRTMSEWCHAYVTATQESTVADNTKVHGAFHAVCHAIFYLVAFKNHHLFMNKESVNFVESLNLPRLVTCALNPLRTCPPQVTQAFSSVTRSHQVVYCQAIIEKNTRLSLQNAHKYDEWFPYDPYTLPASGKIIWPLCMEYKNLFKDGDDETQYNSLKRKLEAEDDDYLIPSPTQKLASSLTNCVSPGFKTSDSIYM